MLEKVFLGEIVYFGKLGKAYREVYSDHWKFVIETSNRRHILLTY